MKVQVNVTSKVNSKAIRREQHNGREHWVVPPTPSQLTWS